jgi:Conjugal transfer protein TraD
MRSWQIERRKRTRHLIELGGLVAKARIEDLTGDDRALIYGARLWMADELSDHGDHAREVWTGKGKRAFEADRESEKNTASQAQHDPK